MFEQSSEVRRVLEVERGAAKTEVEIGGETQETIRPRVYLCCELVRGLSMAKLRKDLYKVATRLDKIAKSDVKFLTDVKPKAEEDFDSELFE